MKHEIHAVTSFAIVGPYVLRLVFEDGTAQTIDFSPVLKGEMFGPLRDLAMFNAVRLDAECHTVVWPNGADFDPATLHDWPKCAAEFIARANTWKEPGQSEDATLRVAETGTPYAKESLRELVKRLRPDKPLIQLWCGARLGLILLRPSGVYYSNQTGGYACYHPLVEGVFVPIHSDELDLEERLGEYFTGPKWSGWCCEGIDEETAAFIDGVLAKSYLTKDVKVDRTRLRDSHEAWVYVDYVNAEESSWQAEISGFGACKAVLTWENSD